MAEAVARERLQPSLLDRLTDDDPTHNVESLQQRVIDIAKLRAVVLRDLAWLFNATRAEPARDSDDEASVAMWQDSPEARRSVINFGLPPLSGRNLVRHDLAVLEREVRDAIATFEPRIDSASISVKAVSAVSQGRGGSTIRFQIRGSLWSLPVPLEVYLRSDLDVETGSAVVREDR